MIGNINELYSENRKGLILGEDNILYFFRADDLLNCSRFQIEEGDQVEFGVVNKLPGTKHDRAIKIRKKSVASSGVTRISINPGINKNVELDRYNEDERTIIWTISKTFYVTNAGGEIVVGNSKYKYILIKPTDFFITMFHLSRELVVVFSDYVEFEPRSLDAAAVAMKRVESKVRLERGVYVLVSNDSNIEKRIVDLLKDTNLNSIVVPFSYYEFLSRNVNDDTIRNRFRKYLYEVDLFSESKPIEDDVFFFGRRDYVQDIAAKCKNNSQCGVFGLRRSGKTSLLYAVKRLLEQEDYLSVYLPCNSEFKELNWNHALFRIIKSIKEETGKGTTTHKEKDYEDENKATSCFADDLVKCLDTQTKPITIMFDEIEYITFKSTTASRGWRDGTGYIAFWNAIRGFCLKYPKRLSIVIAGTNPTINEEPSIEIDGTLATNPMYGQLSQSNQGAYLPPFDIKSTSTMVNTLGGYMGISFSESICAKLTDDCGGHPYLIRLLCKRINNYIQDKGILRPVEITQAIYEKVRPEFEKSSDAQGFYSMILLILQESFPIEYEVLKILATKNYEDISKTQDRRSLMHLFGYGIIDSNQEVYAVKFETVKRFLEGKYRFEVEGLNAEQKRAEINLRLNNAETSIRRIIRQTVHAAHGTQKGKRIIIEAMKNNKAVNEEQIKKADELEYAKLFDPSINTGLYFSVLRDIICGNYNLFINVFGGEEVNCVRCNLSEINKARRAPSHSYEDESENWSEEEFALFRKSMSWLEGFLREFD